MLNELLSVSEPSFLSLENWDNNRPYLIGLYDEKSAWHPLMMRTKRVFGILTLCFLILYGRLVWTRLWLQAEGKDSLQIVTLLICIPGKHLLVWSIPNFESTDWVHSSHAKGPGDHWKSPSSPTSACHLPPRTRNPTLDIDFCRNLESIRHRKAYSTIGFF